MTSHQDGADAAGQPIPDAQPGENAPGLGPSLAAGWLASIRQKLTLPAESVVERGRKLLAEPELTAEFEDELQSMEIAGRGLLALLQQMPASRDDADLPLDTVRRLRHDFLNELNIVEGYAELLLEEFEEAGPAAQAHVPLLRSLESAADELRDIMADVSRHISRLRQAEADGLQVSTETRIRTAELSAQATEVYQKAVSVLAQSARPERGDDASARILAVDDDESNRNLLERRLGNLGFSVELAQDGEQALERLRREPFDLVLTDIIMPNMNGFELLEAMKGDANLRDLPVIMVTAFDDMQSVVRCIEMGADEYLPKTFNPVLMRARIAGLLDKKRLRDREKEFMEQIAVERQRAESLLLNVLPKPIAEELKTNPAHIAHYHEDVTVLFADLVDFTGFAAQSTAQALVEHLNQIFVRFDAIVAAQGLEKIKTVGDAYMLAGGVPEERADHAQAVARAALAMLSALDEVASDTQLPLSCRIGIHSGPVVAGVIGRSKFTYDLWGDTVNIASRMESAGTPGRIQISADTRERLGAGFECESRGLVEFKGRGQLESFFLLGERTP